MLHGFSRSALVLVFSLASTLAYAQGTSTSSISGLVVDTNGAVIPGATAVVLDNATGTTTQVVTNGSGAFSVPSLDAGTYTVTVTLSGFKTVVIKEVKLVAATPANLPKITLEVGNLTETIEVKAHTELVQSLSAAIASTISAQQINSLPMVTQNGSAFISTLAGVDTGGNHQIRSSSVNGLPASATNISLDGISDEDMSGKELWAMVHPKLDQVEEVTVTGAVPGADSSGMGAITVKWVTRSGSNRFQGSGYDYFRHWDLNSNYYFNKVNGLPKNQIELNQFGVREGGPIIKDKLFFFANDEEFRRPGSTTYTRNVLSPTSQSGVFQYTVAGATRQVDLLALAGAKGFTATTDPTVVALLSRITSATQSQGTVSVTADPNVNQYAYQGVAGRIEHNPTVRIDYNLNSTERLSGTYNWQEAYQHPDGLNNNGPTFPGLPNYLDQTSFRNLGSYTLRSTFKSNVINELVGGFLWSPINFSGPLGPAQFVDQGGFALGFPSMNGTSLTSGTVSTAISSRNASHWDLNDTVSWLKGQHSLTFGGTFERLNNWTVAQTAAPGISFGVDTTNDPANTLFTTTNFPGASAQNLTDARSLYGLLTGRVTQIAGNIRLDPSGQYVYGGSGRQEGRQDEYGMFAADSWRATKTLTLNLGLRWEVQMPFQPSNSLYATTSLSGFCGVSGVASDGTCNAFKPGTLNGQVTTYQQYAAGTAGYHTDWNNFAPSLGAAWRPNVQAGFLRTLLGDPEQATIRGGYAVAYNKESITTFSNPFSNNPGLTVTENRNATTGLLVLPGQSWPVLMRDADRLAPPAFCSGTATTLCMPQTVTYPIAASLSNSVNIFDPNWQVANTRSFSVGIQRALSKDMAVEVRYVGTRNHDGNQAYNLNEVTVVENGFVNEYKQAQQNLLANMTAGKGATFAYTGVAGTSPLPIYLANLNGVNAARANDPAQYTGANWTNSTFVNQLGLIQALTPVSTAATSLQSSATFKANMIAAGLPANFWVMNPDVSAANMTRSNAFTQYDAMQVELRRRLAHGFLIAGNYTFAGRYISANDTLRQPLNLIQDIANEVRHALKINWTWELPIGHDRRFGTNMSPWLDDVIGGWEFDGVGRIQSGAVLDFGNVNLVGMSLDELRNAYRVQFRANPLTGLRTVYMLPQDIIDNTILAFSTSATSTTGYAGAAPTGRYMAPANSAACLQVVRGDCAPRDVYVTGPMFTRFDMTARKTFGLGGRRNFQFEADVLNVFNAIGFNAVGTASGSATFAQVTTAYTDVSNTFDPGGRLGQLVFRINW